MNVTVTRPDNLDLSVESEVQLNQQADIAARMAGYRSRREFEIAAKTSLVQSYYPAQTAQPPAAKGKAGK